MPLYEYVCERCGHRFERLRGMSSSKDDVDCPECQGKAERAVSTFASFSKGSDGSSTPIAGGSSCGGCTASTCAGCH